MTVVRAGARATRRGAADNFTGEVFQDEVLVGQAPSRMRATVVSFTPGARTALARPSGRADALLPLRRRPHLHRQRLAAAGDLSR